MNGWLPVLTMSAGVLVGWLYGQWRDHSIRRWVENQQWWPPVVNTRPPGNLDTGRADEMMHRCSAGDESRRRP